MTAKASHHRSSPSAPTDAVGAVVLAAGGSLRLGQPKQLVSMAGEPLVRRGCRLALEAACTPVVVVVGYAATKVRAAVADLPVSVVDNPNWSSGLSGSIAAGIRGLPAVAAAVVVPCDQPGLTQSFLRQLVTRWRTGDVDVVLSRYGADLAAAAPEGPPALFAAGLFAALSRLVGDQGARSVIAAQPPDRVARVAFPQGGMDIDTPADLAALQGSTSAADQPRSAP